MAFFKKLKDRLFKSSSKLDEGLEAIVEDGGVEEALPVDDASNTASDVPVPEVASTPEPTAKPVQDPIPAPAPEQVRDPAPEPEPTPEPEATTAPEPEKIPEPEQAPEPDPEPAASKEPEWSPPPVPEHNVPPHPMPAAKEEPEEVPASEPRDVPADVPAIPPAAQPEPAPAPLKVKLDASPLEDIEPASSAQVPSRGILGRLLGRKDSAPVLRRTLDDDMLEQLEELLIAADMGVDTALRVTANMAEGRMGNKLSVQEIKELMASEIARIMEPVAKPLPLYPQTPQVVLVVGVNGSGKTTTIGKLASQFRVAGKSVVIAAGDTFRAAAVEQLQVWGTRAGVPVLTAPEGSDPASLAFEAMTQAQADGADLLMIDTAGRLQNRDDLMEELAKIVRVIRKKDPSAPHNTLLVLDATTGQNALNQVKVFQEVSDVSGLVMTKLDGTAKGGVLVALADKFGLPIHAIGVGEQIDDLAAFDPEDFAAALTGLDAE
ncbi:MAG: signal recognition particle-docking protein FtsY [Tateyamaria sp.]|uniref:signal recognition particle-docking protein FtsY n=1 Tax=Tateyamaria sp. TaxID=1929288 RepID=UPI00329EA4CE